MAHLDTVSAEDRLAAIHALVSVAKKWVPQDQYLLYELGLECGSESSTPLVCAEALNEVARAADESISGWMAFERELGRTGGANLLASIDDAVLLLSRPNGSKG